MIAPEYPPGFVVRTEAQMAAWNNGIRLEYRKWRLAAVRLDHSAWRDLRSGRDASRSLAATICQAAINVTGDPFPSRRAIISRYQDALGPIISRLAGSLCVAFSTTIVFPIWTRLPCYPARFMAFPQYGGRACVGAPDRQQPRHHARRRCRRHRLGDDLGGGWLASPRLLLGQRIRTACRGASGRRGRTAPRGSSPTSP